MNRNLLASAILFISLILSFMLASIAHPITVTASTNFSGMITSDTTWTLEQSPVIVTGDIRVAEDVTLKIEPGVTISFAGSYYLEIRGTLEAIGTTNSPISFTSNSSQERGSWVGIRNWAYEASSYPHVRTKGNITLNYCVIEYASIGVTGSLENDGEGNIANVIVVNSKFIRNSLGIRITCREYSDAYGYITNNTLLYNNAGITIENRYNSPVLIVEDNIIALNVDNGITIIGHPYPGDTILRRNLITGNEGTGVSITGSHTHTQSHIILTQNSITSNGIGLYVSLEPLYLETLVIAEITGNNIYSNEQYDLQVGTPITFPTNLNAINNYWGTTNSTLIDQCIYDFNDNWDLVTVDYIPFLDERAPLAPDPDLLPVPTPTPSPTPSPSPSEAPTEPSSIPKPSVPEFTMKYVELSYDVPPTYGTDPYTGEKVITQEGYHVENQSVVFKIKNQPFTPYNDTSGNNICLYYNFRFKGHYDDEWQYYPFSESGQGTRRYSAMFYVLIDSSPKLAASNSEYTEIVFSLSFLLGEIPPVGSQVDFQVQALIGHIDSEGSGYYSYTGQTSDWSNTYIITTTIGESETPTTTPSPSPIPVPDQSYFFVESNSTVSELFFNSTSGELSFTVTGEKGTEGYVKVTIAKSLVPSVQDVKVYLDGTQLNVAITEDEDSWLLRFTYTHSTHHVTVYLGSVEFDESQIGQALIIGLPIAAVVLLFAIPKIRDRKAKTSTK